MKTAQLKSSLHQLIDEINDAATLRKFKNLFNVIIQSETKKDWWDDLTEEEKKDLEDAFTESEDESQWINHSEVMKMAKTWLKK